MNDKTKSVIIRDFPVDLHAEFKSLCRIQELIWGVN
jgi:hypothetical protein